MQLKENAPLHVKEGRATEWRSHFAWWPVRLEQGGWAWMRSTWRRRFQPPAWFCPPAPIDGWNEYSDQKKSFWEQLRGGPGRSTQPPHIQRSHNEE